MIEKALPFAAVPILVLLQSVPAAAGPQIPEPETRLVIAGGPPDGDGYRIGVEISLPPGWHTYWRNPGEAGLPPIFDTAGSANLAAFEVAYPAPQRWSDGFSTSIVYHDTVLLPARVVPSDPGQPVDLAIGLDFGFCREICIPAHAELSVRLDPSDPPDDDGSRRIEAALAAVPKPEADAPADAPHLLEIKRTGDDGATAVLRITVEAGDADAVDLFAEPPDGWYLVVPRKLFAVGRGAVFEIPLKGMPKGAHPVGASFRFTLVDGRHAVEAVRILD